MDVPLDALVNSGYIHLPPREDVSECVTRSIIESWEKAEKKLAEALEEVLRLRSEMVQLHQECEKLQELVDDGARGRPPERRTDQELDNDWRQAR